jgi:hypothetical protein
MEVKLGADVIPLPLKNGGTSAAILNLVQKRVDEKMEFLMCGLKENIADALFEEMAALDGQEALKRHFNIMRVMKFDEAKYQAKFEELSSHLWSTFSVEMDDSRIGKPSGKIAELTRQMSYRAANHYKVLIQETRRRFQTLLKRTVDIHPLLPEYYYRCFWQSLGELDLTYEERSFIMPLFHRFVMDRYGQMLLTANQTLIELKVDITIQHVD